ncbi:MAG: DUF6266 family protein [Bacteroidales bacterium]|nr:DUF6266 family protein [Bacteroidales bacterium]MDY6370703.1 DUF6266 family protein [Bacteroidales bacterium]
MGKISQGILDGFKGKVGTVVGFFWKGKPVMRGYKRFIRDRHSDAQLIVRLRFATLNELSVAFKAAADLGYKRRAKSHGNTELNNFVQLNWNAVTADSTAEVTVDYSALLLSAGSLPGVHFDRASFENPQTVEVPFLPNSAAGGASEDDTVYLFAYNPTLGSGQLSRGDLRSNNKATLTLPPAWSGETAHLWGFVVNQQGVPSYSAYLGEGTIG